MITQTFYIYDTKAVILTVDPVTNEGKWKLLEPWDLLIMTLGNKIPVRIQEGDNYGIKTISDLKIKIYGTDTFVVES